jgi:hypothetical protein
MLSRTFLIGSVVGALMSSMSVAESHVNMDVAAIYGQTLPIENDQIYRLCPSTLVDEGNLVYAIKIVRGLRDGAFVRDKE